MTKGGRVKPIDVAALIAVTLLVAGRAGAQQVSDSTFDTRIARPAFTKDGPRLLFDEAHFNFHTAGGRYKVFADLATHDGFRVTPNHEGFTPARLSGFDVLVIANALGNEDLTSPDAEKPAFTPGECDAVRDWVRAGGALLLIADHAPTGAATRPLAERFGVDMRNAYAVDPGRAVDDNSGLALFTAGGGLDTTHPIVRGRDASERVRRVISFTGQSLAGPDSARSILTFSPRAEDLMVGFGQHREDVPKDKRKSAAGRSQMLALGFGRGRVVVLGEAAMFSAQLAGPGGRVKMGMNYPGIDNRQLALNTLRWLVRAPR
jgi:hypothetical protein